MFHLEKEVEELLLQTLLHMVNKQRMNLTCKIDHERQCLAQLIHKAHQTRVR